MKVDFLSYRIAASRSILGLVLQVLITVALLIYGLLARDHAALTASGYSGAGVLAWIALTILFDQHRRERVEAMESESLTQQVGTASVFEGEGEFRVAKARLTSLYRWFIPTVSLLIGAVLIAFGLWRFWSGRELISPDAFGTPHHQSAAGVLGIVVACAGFVYARFISGMAKQPVWANLRGGAAYSVGSALMGFLIALGSLVDLAGPDIISRYLPVVLPVAIIGLGCEIFLNFVIELYRPRAAGGVARPAFDSRVLGFVAAPDRIAKSISDAINYQLGFDVSSSWFYRLISQWLGTLVLTGLGLVWLLSCMTVIDPSERAVVLRFGALQREIGPGIHFKAPWPIDRVEVPPVLRKNDKGRLMQVGATATGVRTMDLGTPAPGDDKVAILWTNEHAREEVYQIVHQTPGDARASSGSNAGAERDLGLVSAEIPMEYAIENVVAYETLGTPEQRDDFIKAIAQREVLGYLSTLNINELLGADNAVLSRELIRRIEKALAAVNVDPATGKARGAGVKVLKVAVTHAHPPKEAAPKFELVVQAEQKQQAGIEAARKDAIDTLTQVVGSVDLARNIAAEIQELNRLTDSARGGDAKIESQLKDRELAIQNLLGKAGGWAAKVVAEARAMRWAKHMGERARAASYQGQMAGYDAFPMLYRTNLYFESLAETMKQSRVFVLQSDPRNVRVTYDLQDIETSASLFQANPDK